MASRLVSSTARVFSVANTPDAEEDTPSSWRRYMPREILYRLSRGALRGGAISSGTADALFCLAQYKVANHQGLTVDEAIQDFARPLHVVNDDFLERVTTITLGRYQQAFLARAEEHDLSPNEFIAIQALSKVFENY